MVRGETQSSTFQLEILQLSVRDAESPKAKEPLMLALEWKKFINKVYFGNELANIFVLN